MIESSTRTDRLWLAACIASLAGYILCSTAVRKFVSEMARLIETYMLH